MASKSATSSSQVKSKASYETTHSESKQFHSSSGSFTTQTNGSHAITNVSASINGQITVIENGSLMTNGVHTSTNGVHTTLVGELERTVSDEELKYAYAHEFSQMTMQQFIDAFQSVALSREGEQDLFAILNTRLSEYIQIVRHWKDDKSDFREFIKQIETMMRTNTTHIDSVISTEVDVVNKKCQQLLIEKTNVVIELENALNDYNSLKDQFDRLEKEHRIVIEECSSLKKIVSVKDIRITEIEKENKSLQYTIKDVRAQLDKERIQHEEMTRKREEYLKEEYERSLTTVKTVHKTQVDQMQHIAKIDWEKLLQRETVYHDNLTERIIALRQDFERILLKNKYEIEQAVKLIHLSINFDATYIQRIIDESREARMKAVEYERENKEYKARITILEQHITQLENIISTSKVDVEKIIKESYSGLEFVKKDVVKKLSKFAYLMELKVKLDAELETYRLLLDAEQIRIDYQQKAHHHHGTARSFVKEGHSEEDVQIDEVNLDGKYICLTNKGTEEFNLGSWLIVAKADDGKDKREFKFSASQTVMPGKTLTIWSPNMGVTHNSPNNIVLVGDPWPSGDSIRVELFDTHGHELAWHKSYYKEQENCSTVDHTQHHDTHEIVLHKQQDHDAHEIVLHKQQEHDSHEIVLHKQHHDSHEVVSTNIKPLIIEEIVTTVTGQAEKIYSNSHSDVEVVVNEINMQGDYVSLTNNGKKEFNLGAWHIVSKAGTVVHKFKFPNKHFILPGKTTKIWSHSKGGTDNPPDSIVMKAINWPSGNHIRIELLDNNDNRKAWKESSYESGAISIIAKT